MNLSFDLKLADRYTSNSQIARVLTESWVKQNAYCPNCGEASLNEFENNKPVADFYCKKCKEEFELKSKSGNLGSTINDGAYDTMIKRITSDTNPNFFFLTYKKNYSVDNFLIIPKHFFTPDIIIKRNALSPSAKRAGWIGCNIGINKVPSLGRIFLINNSQIINQKEVINKWESTRFLANNSLEARGWTMDVLNCIDLIETKDFSLQDAYSFEATLKQKHSKNNFIKDKIRQQLQVLRDRNIIEFIGRGRYRKLTQ